MKWSVSADPMPFICDTATTALLLIDMQRDFLEPGGFGEALGNNVALLQPTVRSCERLLEVARTVGFTVIHTREGHLPDLSDVFPTKQARCAPGQRIGDAGPMGRILVRGEPGHAIVPALAPASCELLIDKSGKGAFYATPLMDKLLEANVKSLIVAGVTTEVCVHTTVREANDRGFECLVVGDACGSYFPEFHEVGLRMISAQGGIFGKVASLDDVLAVAHV